MSGPLHDDVGYLGNTPQSQAILNGTYVPPPGLSEGAVRFIQHLRTPPSIVQEGPMPNDISTDSYQYYWKKAKEQTSSGVSGLHFGHYKAGLWSPKLWQLEHGLTNIPNRTGYSPDRWRKCVDVMLLKKELVFLVNKLRTIVLLEPDFQELTKNIGRTSMRNALKHNVMCRENFGGIKDRNQVEAALIKLLFYDTARQRKIPCCLCSNDAKACYNRIIHVVMSLCFQRLGVPLEPLISALTTMQNMIHQVRTPYGDSTATHGEHNPATEKPQQGAFQGIGHAPAAYASMSSVMNDALREAGYGIQFTSAITKIVSVLASICFVDDDDQAENARTRDEQLALIHERLQAAVALWGEMLDVTGGELAPVKSFWYLIDFIWTPTGHFRYALATEHAECKLYMPDSQGHQVEVERVCPTKGMKTLGIHLAPDGSVDDELAKLKAISVTWGDHIKSSHLKPNDAWFALNHSLLPKVTWHAAVTTFTEEQWATILSPALTRGLQKSKMCSNFPRDFLYAPLQYQGRGMKNPAVTAGLRKIGMIFKHAGSATPVEDAIRVSLEDLKVELGMPGTPFQHSLKLLGRCAQKSWLKSIWSFVRHHNLRLVDPGPHLSLQRCHDRFLMEAFYSAGYTAKKLAKLNRCRLFLVATTLADICTADGRSITTAAWNGIQSSHIQTPATWPNQGKLPKDDWDLWRLALRQEFLNFYERDHRLQLPLGHWLPDSTTAWIWWYSPLTDRLYKTVSATTGLVSDAPQGTNQRKKFLMTPNIELLPTDLRRVSVYQAPRTEHFRIEGAPGTTLPPHCSCSTSAHPSYPQRAGPPTPVDHS